MTGNVVRFPVPARRRGWRVVPLIVGAHLDWMRQAGHADSTIDKRRRVLARVAAFTGAPVDEASRGQLAEWRASQTAGNDAVAADLSQVRMFFAWLVREGLRDDDPSENLPRPRLSQRLPRPIPEDHLERAIENAWQPIRAMLVLAAGCGLRAKEIALLRRERVLETRRQPVLLVAADATKGRHERYVPMSDWVVVELLPVLPASGWVFRRARGRGSLTPNYVSHLVSRYMDSIGLPESLHHFRHRFGTVAYEVDHDIRTVQGLLGHAHLSTTAIYTKVTPEAAVATVQAMPVPRHLKVVSRNLERRADL